MAILKVKDENGKVTDIPAIRGKTAYEYAKDGGYTGTEEEFAKKMGEELPEWAKSPEKPVYDASEISRGFPLGNMKLRLINDITIGVDEEGNLPSYVEVTTDKDGKPFSCKAIVILTDIKSGYSYTPVVFNQMSWFDASGSLAHDGKINSPVLFIAGADMITVFGGNNNHIGKVSGFANSNNKPYPIISEIKAITVPANGVIASGTRLIIYEVV